MHYTNWPSSHKGVFSPTLQSEVEKMTDVPVTGLISKTNEHGCVDYKTIYSLQSLYLSTVSIYLSIHTLISFQPVNKNRPSSQRNTFSLENIDITEHFHQATFQQPAPEALTSYYNSINCNKSDSYLVRLIETAKPALAHSLANTQLHLRVWLVLVKHL